MFFWKSLTFSMTQWMLAIWSLVPLPFLNPIWTSGSSWFTYRWSLAWRILSITLLACEMSASNNNHLSGSRVFVIYYQKEQGRVSSFVVTKYWESMDCSLPGFTSNGFSRQEYWSGLPFPSPGDLPVPEIKFTPPALQAYYLLLSPQGSPVDRLIHVKCVLCSHLVDVVCSHLIANIFVHSFFFFFFYLFLWMLPISSMIDLLLF